MASMSVERTADMRTVAVCLAAISSGPALAETLEAMFQKNEKPAYECMKRDVGRLMETSDYSHAAVRQIGEIVAYLCTQELREKIRQTYPNNSFHAGESAAWIQLGAQEIAQSIALKIRKQKGADDAPKP
jgi:hypothetical protein